MVRLNGYRAVLGAFAQEGMEPRDIEAERAEQALEMIAALYAIEVKIRRQHSIDCRVSHRGPLRSSGINDDRGSGGT